LIVYLNGSEKELEQETTVAALVAELAPGGHDRGVAVALNAEVVPKSEWVSTSLAAGDRVEVLVAVQGG
jgi:sulfur carrier protein